MDVMREEVWMAMDPETQLLWRSVCAIEIIQGARCRGPEYLPEPMIVRIKDFFDVDIILYERL